ncbi:MAG TPA: acetyltransferase [Myxococcota bacterium]|nr:acetyltransferase [Myxococcota bacterium]
MREKLILFPFGGNALEAVDCLGDEFELIGFVDDAPEKQGRSASFEVHSRELLERYPEAKVLAVPGSPTSYRRRRDTIAGLGVREERFARVIHPRATVANRRNVGFNTLLMAGVVVTSNAQIGNHVCILPNSVIHHDAVIRDHALIGSNVTVAGHVIVGAQSYIGSGSTLIDHSEIGENALVGLGSNVIRPVPPGARVVGNPAKELA